MSYNVKNFDDALKIMTESGIGEISGPESNNVPLARILAKELIGQMRPEEKIYLLGGHYNYVGEFFKSLIKLKSPRFYNPFPIKGGGCRRLKIPPIAFTDGPRGVVMNFSTCFPTATARAAAFDTELEYEIGEAIAKESIARGANYFAGVCINLLRHPAWGRAQEAYGEDQFLLAEMGKALTRAVQKYGIIACPKHYALNSIENLRFKVDVTASGETLRDVYLPHFKACVDAGAGSVMGAYNLFNGDYSCESKTLLTDILRGEWNFEGFTISDFFFGVRNAAKSLNAGLDMEMPTSIKRRFGLPKALKTGEVTAETVDKCCENIISTLLRFQPVYRQYRFDETVVCCKAHIELARKALEKGAVLLKNDGVLPITDKNARLAVVGRWADRVNVGDHGSSSVHAPYVTTFGQAARDSYKNARVLSSNNIARCRRLAEKADKIIVAAGFSHFDEGEYILPHTPVGGDRKDLRLRKSDVALIKAMAATGKPVTVIYFAGSAAVIEDWKDDVSAIIYASYPGMEGGRALVNIISGKVNPSGKLPFTIARRTEDYPPFLYGRDKKTLIEYGYYHGYAKFEKEGITPAYPFGFGLSYTTFKYSNLKCEKIEDKVRITVDITNTGSVVGDETAQFYIGTGIIGKPHKLLKGFARITLEAGETKTLEHQIDIGNLKLYDGLSEKYILPRKITVYAGGTSEDGKLLKQPLELRE